jgi:hypothetical protein
MQFYPLIWHVKFTALQVISTELVSSFCVLDTGSKDGRMWQGTCSVNIFHPPWRRTEILLRLPNSNQFVSRIKKFAWLPSDETMMNIDRLGRTIAQAVSRQIPTPAGRVRAQVRSCGNCGGQSGTGEGFFRVLRFPLPILIPPTAPHWSSSSIIRGWYNRPISGRLTKWTQSHPTPKKQK